MNNPSMPPIGIMPMKIWQEITRTERMNELLKAMYRYSIRGLVLPAEWIDELAQHIEDTKEYLRGLNTGHGAKDETKN